MIVMDGIVVLCRCCPFDICGNVLFDCGSFVAVIVVVVAAVVLFLLCGGVVVLVLLLGKACCLGSSW